MKQNKLQLWLPLLLSVVMIIGMVIGYKLRKDTVGDNTFLNNYNNTTISQVLTLIKKNYVDNINTDSLQLNAVNNLLLHLDPYSVYIPPTKRSEINDEKNGSFLGLGIGFEVINDSVYITDVTKGSPAYIAGVRQGDIFLDFNDSIKLSGPQKTTKGVANLIKELKSPLKISIYRAQKSFTVNVKKEVLPIHSVDAAYMLDNKTAYIRLNTFSETTYKECMYALEMLKKKGMQQLIIDLRGNTGGVMTSAIEIANEFLQDQQLIVYTQGAKTGKKEYRCKRDGLYTDLKLSVLIDETTASASEILAGALQDWDRATIIGRRSFGKGFVENQYKLNNGAALRLTVARYYTPLGRNIQKSYKSIETYKKELATRFHNGETLLGDTASPKGKQFKTPKGRIVYGGGGITPDVSIPYDTTIISPLIAPLFLKGTLMKFAFIYYINNVNSFAAVHSSAELNSILTPQKEIIWQSLNTYASADSISLANVNSKTKENILEKFIAFISKNKFGTSGYYEINNQHDEIINETMKLFNSASK